MKKTKIIFWVFILLVLLWVCVQTGMDKIYAYFYPNATAANAASTSTSAESGPITLGVMLPLSGPAALYGAEAENVYESAVAEINQSGGISGRQVALDTVDSSCTASGGEAAASQLARAGVQVIVGGLCGEETSAAMPVAESSGIVVFSPADEDPQAGTSSLFLRDYPTTDDQANLDAETLYDQGRERVAVIHELSGRADNIYNAFKSKFTDLGGEVVQEGYATSTGSFASYLSNLRGRAPEVLFVDAETPDSASLILDEVKRMGWKVHIMLNDVELGDQSLVSSHEAQLEGALGSEFTVDASSTEYQRLSSAYVSRYGKAIVYANYAATEYDAIYILKDAIIAVGYNGAKIAQWVRGLNEWDGASGSVSIDSNGDRRNCFTMKVVKRGQVQSLEG